VKKQSLIAFMLSNLSTVDTLDIFCLPELFSRFTKYEENLYTSTDYVDDTNNVECQECAVCLCQNVGYLRKLDCGHTFHNCCINTWLTKKQQCPECRSDVIDEFLNDDSESIFVNINMDWDVDNTIFYPFIIHPHWDVSGQWSNLFARPELRIDIDILNACFDNFFPPNIRLPLLSTARQESKMKPTIINNNPYKPKKSYKKYERQYNRKKESRNDINRYNKSIRR
jgi:hypothetical protein